MSALLPHGARAIMASRIRWDPDASTATSYSWFVWVRGIAYGESRTRLIPPCRQELHRASDVLRWCPPAPLPLFEGVA